MNTRHTSVAENISQQSANETFYVRPPLVSINPKCQHKNDNQIILITGKFFSQV